MGCLWPQVSLEVHRLPVGLRTRFCTAYVHACCVGAGCWQEAWAPCLVGLSVGVLRYPQNVAPGFSQSK